MSNFRFKKRIKKSKYFKHNKIYYLPDAIISIKELNKKLNTPNDYQITKNKELFYLLDV